MLSKMSPLLAKAQKGGYAVPMFDVFNIDMLLGIIDAAEETNSPVILAYFDGFVPFIELEIAAAGLIRAAERASVPVAVHLDHGSSLDLIVRALREGFTSVMVDASTSPLEENIAITQKVVELARICNVDVEAELGHVAGQEYYDKVSENQMYTLPSEAKYFIDATNVDALAVSIGSVHGVYHKKPALDFERLAEIRDAIDTPLVLHGGSGISDDDFRRLIKTGISKINIFTDLTIASVDIMRAGTDAPGNASYIGTSGQIRKAVKEAAIKKIKIFSSDGKA